LTYCIERERTAIPGEDVLLASILPQVSANSPIGRPSPGSCRAGLPFMVTSRAGSAADALGSSSSSLHCLKGTVFTK
jgi:hypothetical protein